MVILLYGEDSYRSRQKLNEIIEHYKSIHKSGINLKYFEGKDLNFEDLKEEFRQTSMFDEKKLLVVNDVFSNGDFKEKFLKNQKEILDSKEVILFYEEGTPKEEQFLKFLKLKADCQEFKPLKRESLKIWLKKEFAVYQTDISPEARELLIDFVGDDIWQLSNEIKKLINFKSKKRIMPEDVELLVKPKIENDIFKTVDAMAQRNKKQAIFLIHKHLETGDSPHYLLSMINFQFRNLLIIKDLIEKNQPYYAILKISKLHPFVVKKSYQEANKFTFPELKKIYQKIFQVDLAIKTGRVSPEAALDLFLAGI